MLDPSSSSLDEVVRVLDEYRRAGYLFGITALDVLLCSALLKGRQPDAALEAIEQGLSTVNQGERVFESELYRLKACAVLACGAPDAGTHAQSLLEHALTTAGSQCARSLELRVARDLAALWIDQGRRNKALNFLTPFYERFSEGLESQDLTSVRNLLRQLQDNRPSSPCPKL